MDEKSMICNFISRKQFEKAEINGLLTSGLKHRKSKQLASVHTIKRCKTKNTISLPNNSFLDITEPDRLSPLIL